MPKSLSPQPADGPETQQLFSPGLRIAAGRVVVFSNIFSVAILSALLATLFVVADCVAEGGEERAVAGRFRHLSIADGLPNSRVFELAEDQDGFLWLGTQNGLGRFDGHEFEVFGRDQGTRRWLPDPYITSIHAAPDGGIWVGTFTGVVGRFDPRRLRFEKRDLDLPEGCSRLVNMVRGLPNGDVLVGGGFGLYRLPGGGGEEAPAERLLGDEECDVGVSDGVVDRSGTLWIVGSPEPSPLYSWRGERDELRGYRLETGAGIQSLCLGLEDEIYLLPLTGGPWVFDPQGESARPLPGMEWAADTSFERCMVDRRGSVWLSPDAVGTSDTLRGLFEVSADGSRMVHHRPRMELPGRPQDRTYLSMLEDRNGLLWFGGLSQGVDWFDPRRNGFEILLSRENVPLGLAAGYVLSIAETPDGGAWVGFFGAGLQRLEPGRIPGQQYSPANSDLRHGFIWSLVLDDAGDLWIGHEEGLDVRSAATGKFSAVAEGALPSGRVIAMEETSNGELWLGGPGFVGILDRSQDEPVWRSMNEDLATPVLSLAEDDGQGIWIGFDGAGLGWLDRRTGELAQVWSEEILGHGVVSSVEPLAQGSALISTLGSGVIRIDREAGVVGRFRISDGLSSNAVKSLRLGQGGIAWATSELSVDRIDLDSGNIRRFEVPHDRGRPLGFATKVAYAGEERLWFGSRNGLLSFRPEALDARIPAPPAALTWLEIGHRRVELQEDDPDSPLSQAVHQTESITLDYQARIVSIGFTALDFSAPERHLFRYRLEGFDEDWVSTDARERFARYSSLPAGRYRFHVQASFGDGDWGPPSILEIRVKPPWWRSFWAYALYVLAICGVLGRVYLKQRHQVKTLGGLLPICASCKKIRDDEGYWQEVEAYVSDHSSAYFSHGLCPPCFERSIAEVEDDEDWSS